MTEEEFRGMAVEMRGMVALNAGMVALNAGMAALNAGMAALNAGDGGGDAGMAAGFYADKSLLSLLLPPPGAYRKPFCLTQGVVRYAHLPWAGSSLPLRGAR